MVTYKKYDKLQFAATLYCLASSLDMQFSGISEKVPEKISIPSTMKAIFGNYVARFYY